MGRYEPGCNDRVFLCTHHLPQLPKTVIVAPTLPEVAPVSAGQPAESGGGCHSASGRVCRRVGAIRGQRLVAGPPNKRWFWDGCTRISTRKSC